MGELLGPIAAIRYARDLRLRMQRKGEARGFDPIATSAFTLSQGNLAQLVRSNAKSLPKFVTVKPRKVGWLVAYGTARFGKVLSGGVNRYV